MFINCQKNSMCKLPFNDVRKLIYTVTIVGITKYLRHSESVSAKHYDFSVIEQSARNRAAIVNLIGGMTYGYLL